MTTENPADPAPQALDSLRNVRDIHVLWPDCDPAGILFYGNYFRWMDDATFFLFERAGLRKDRMLADYGMLGMPLVAAHADFRSPAKFGDVLSVESFVSAASARTFTVTHNFRVGERLAAEGWEKRVWAKAEPGNPSRITALPIPPEVRAALGVQ
jgi:4-hydroxybenzoyl-CoA thioesterase